MYHRPNDVKATLSRSEALKSKKAKAEPRPSSVVLKSKKEALAAPPKASRPVSATVAKPSGRAKPAEPPASKAAIKTPPQAASAPKAAAPKSPLVSPKLRGDKASLTAALPKASKAAVGTKGRAPASTKLVDSSPPSVSKKPVRKSIKEAAGVSTDAVARRTGKTWDDWFEVLDSAGAATLDQRGIVAILAQKHGIGPWWQQMIAVGYESLRGKTDKPVAVDGFQISETCTLSAPVARVFKLWNDASERARWLADDRFVVKSATPGKSLRARWGKGNSQVAVSFQEKSGKTEVAVEHQHIESQTAAEQMKAYWQKKLGLLDDALGERR
ncbi:MAG: SRPBCC domain-containing protein [Myxococcales bacterium]|nr:MAG: SRPBCC domain-containing protein [Myxococcales bacterium]